MKIILSHDIDHMTVWEHTFKDLILPKYIVRSKIELLTGKIGLKEFALRIGDLFQNQWQRIEEVMNFHDSLEIKSTFFIGVNNGVGLSYPISYVKKWAPIISKRNFEIGVHGIAYDNEKIIQKEFKLLKDIIGHSDFGIRMHYLRQNENTLNFLENAGYTYDASTQGFKNPYKIGDFWEFPLQIMDGWVINGDNRRQTRNLQQAKEYTLQQIEKAHDANLTYLSILFHDRYFSSSFQTWKDWYTWLVEYLVSKKYTFVSHKQAISELE